MNRRPLILSSEESETLQNLVRRPRTPQNLALRARIVILCAEGRMNHEVAKALGVSLHTVGKWRKRYMMNGVDGLVDQPRSGKPRRYVRSTLEAMILSLVEAPPTNGGRWTVRSVAKALAISPATIGRVWRALRLRRRAEEQSSITRSPPAHHELCAS
jgi:transposase